MPTMSFRNGDAETPSPNHHLARVHLTSGNLQEKKDLNEPKAETKAPEVRKRWFLSLEAAPVTWSPLYCIVLYVLGKSSIYDLIILKKI